MCPSVCWSFCRKIPRFERKHRFGSHCHVIAGERSDEAIQESVHRPLDCFASLAMTGYEFSRSRDAFFAPEAWQATARIIASE